MIFIRNDEKAVQWTTKCVGREKNINQVFYFQENYASTLRRI